MTTQPRPAASARALVLPEGLSWRRMHVITPLLEGWKAISAVVAFGVIGNIDDFVRAYRYIRRHGVPLDHSRIHVIILGLVAVVLLGYLFLLVSWWARRYAVDADAVYLQRGVLMKKVRVARLPRIQSVDVVYPLLGRVLGLGQLTVEVAGGQDSRVVIGYLPATVLDELRVEILALAAGAAPDPGSLARGENGKTEPVSTKDASTTAPPEASVDGLGQSVPLYSVDISVLLRSTVRSWLGIITGVLVAAIIAGALYDVVYLRNGPETLGLVLPLLVVPLSTIGMAWSRFNTGWNFQAHATPAGIRKRYGLTADTTNTLPPGRVHAVILEQGPLWHSPDWWRVTSCLAGREDASGSNLDGNTGKVLLPVGDRDTALRALWLVIPDLGVEDPDSFLDAALSGSGDEGVGPEHTPLSHPGRGFVRVPRRSRLFSPLVWRREAIALTDTCVVLRRGRWLRKTVVVPYERIQSLRLRQGPVARRLHLATVALDLVEATPDAVMSNLDSSDAARVAQIISERALRRRHEEHLDRWLSRVTTSIGAPVSSGTPGLT